MVKHMREGFRRAIVCALVFLLLLSCISSDIYGAAIEKGDVVTISEGKELIGADGKPYYLAAGYYTARFSNSKGTGFDYRVCLATSSKNTLVINNGKSRYQGYCLEHGAWMNPGSTSYKATVTQLKTLYWLKPYSESTIKWIELALLFGKQPGMTEKDVPVEGCNLDDWYFATQNIIWEFQQGLRSSPSSIKSNPKTQPANWYSKTMKGRPAYKLYTWMLDQMERYDKVQSFASKKSGSAPLLKLKDNGDGTWSGTFKDTKKVAQNIKANNEHVTISRNGNEYTISTDVAPSELGVVKCKKDVAAAKIKQPLLAFTTGQSSHISNHLQSVVWGASDPVELYIRLGEGEQTEEETPEPELPDFHVDISKVDLNPGFDGDPGTGMGDAALNAGITVTVTTDSGEIEEYIELDEYGESDGFTFSPWLDCTQLKKEITKDEEHTYVTYTAEASVVVEETTVPDGRYEESSEAGGGKRSHTISYFAQSVDNGPFSYRIEADGEVYNDIGQEPLPLKADEFVNDNFRGRLQIIKTKTDLDPFTENGEGVTGSEGSSSGTGEGSDTVSKGEYSTKSKWTVKLVSGGYEDSPYIKVVPLNEGEAGYDSYAQNYRVVRDEDGVCADEDHPLTVSQHGRINIVDLPYGTYEVNEIAADSPGYVLESFTVRVTDEEQKISVTAQNIPKRNKVKIVKVNSETGKTVRLEGAVFRIKYMGNPDSQNPEEDENYGKYLPNGSDPQDGSDYIFQCNENGEIALPYQLEYGNYQLEELIVPEGYFVGDYDDIKEFNVYSFSVTEQDSHVDGEDYITYYVTVNMENKPVKGNIVIQKTGEIVTGWKEVQLGAYIVFQAVWEKCALEGTVFQIYAAEDVEQADGVVPIKAFYADGSPIDLKLISRDHSETEGGKEVHGAELSSGGKITQTSEKSVSDKNKTTTVYEVSDKNEASFKTSFVREENGVRCSYLIECEMRYSLNGMNYTAVHLKKETSAEEGVQLQTDEPVVTYGEEELELIDVILPDDSRIVQNADNISEAVDERNYLQEYDFELVQHFESKKGFSFAIDDIRIESIADNDEGRAVTRISGVQGDAPQIEKSGAYTYEKADGVHVFTSSPEEDFPVCFQTNDGIKTAMVLAAGLTHTRITVTQSQLFQFDGVYPKVLYKGDEIDWNGTLTPSNDSFIYTIDDRNYVKAYRHERSPDNDEVYYTLDIVSDGTRESGFLIRYPDTTEAVPVLSGKNSGALYFTAVDDTLIYPTGSPIKTVVTDKDGTAVIEHLPLGKYYIHEISSVSGQVNKGEWKEFELLYKDQSTPIVWQTGEFENEAVCVKVDLSKLFQAEPGSEDYVTGSGAVFGIYTAEEISALPADTPVGILTVSESAATAELKLPQGRYYIREISAPAGYKLNPYKFYFDVADILSSDELKFGYKGEGISGTVTAEGNGKTAVELDCLYRYPEEEISVSGGKKTVSVLDGRSIYRIEVDSGEKTEIRLENGSAITVEADGDAYRAVFSGSVKPELDLGKEENLKKTEEGGSVIVSYLPKVTRTCFNCIVSIDTEDVQEKTTDFTVSVPLAAEELRGSFDKESQTVVFSGWSGQAAETVKLKRGECSSVAAAEEIRFDLEFDDSGVITVLASGETEGELSGEPGVRVDGFAALPEYVDLQMVSAKTYARNNTAAELLHVVIGTIKNEAVPTEPGEENPKPPAGRLEIIKIDAENGEVLAGAEFEILNSEKEVIFRGVTSAEGKLTVEDLKPGTYYYRETKAPEGYVLDDELHPIEITAENTVVKVKMENDRIPEEPEKPEEPEEPDNPKPEKPKNPEKPAQVPEEDQEAPKTGDDTGFEAMLLLIAALLSLTLIMALKRKNNRM